MAGNAQLNKDLPGVQYQIRVESFFDGFLNFYRFWVEDNMRVFFLHQANSMFTANGAAQFFAENENFGDRSEERRVGKECRL